MLSITDRPRGLITRKNPSSTIRLYWTCTKAATKLGYKPTLVPVHATDDKAVKEVCQRLEGQMLAFISKRTRPALPQTERVTVSFLFRQYREREASGFHRVKWNTRRTYSQILDALEAVAGDMRLSEIDIDVLWRLYNDTCWPNGRGIGAGNMTKAHNFISLLRRAMSFGVKAEIPGCARVKAILDEERFPVPKPRVVRPDYGHVMAFIRAAKAQGRLSLALGTALQFECGLRQRDVIGEWVIHSSGVISDYVLNRRQWINGLVWGDISADGVLTKRTTKTGAVVSHDLSSRPIILCADNGINRGKRKSKACGR